MKLEDLFQLEPLVEEIHRPSFEAAGVRVRVLREDLRHPIVGGNKLWKLRHVPEAFHSSGADCIVSFGGAFSNHLNALSTVCHWMDLPFHAIIRGEERPVNNRIEHMIREGTTIHYCSRTSYRQKEEPEAFQSLVKDLNIPPKAFLVPEGGNSAMGRRGCLDLGKIVPVSSNHFLLACGTGTTMAGVLDGIDAKIKVTGIPVVRSGNTLEKMMRELYPDKSNYALLHGYEEGGYGKSSERLEHFIHNFTTETGIPIEPVYTGKLFFALNDLSGSGYFSRGDDITVLHSGGIPGI
jgi:1-aminocyclopropane-1-carboxylate deaminase